MLGDFKFKMQNLEGKFVKIENWKVEMKCVVW